MCAAKISFLSPRRRVLMTGDEGVVLFAVTSTKTERLATIPWMVPNFEEQLYEALDDKRYKFPVLVLYDAVEQHYRKETLPRVGALDRAKVLKRKLDLTFPSYPVRAALQLKPSGKKQLREARNAPPSYLFTAIPGTETVNKIGDALIDAQVSIAGLALLPLESTGLVEKLAESFVREGKQKSRWSIMIGQHETGGLRQIVVRDGMLALTRLTPAGEGGMDGAEWAAEVEREFKATLSYIARFGYNAAEGLDVIIICSPGSKDALEQFNLPATNLKCMTVAQAAHTAEIDLGAEKPTAQGNTAQEYADVLHAAWNGLKFKSILPLKVPALERIQKPRVIAQALGVAMIIGILALGANLAERARIYYELGQESENMEAQRNLLSREYEQEAAVFETLPINPDYVAAVLDIHEELEATAMRANPFLNRVRQVMLPEALIESISIEDQADKKATPKRGGRRGVASSTKEDSTKFSVSIKFELPRIKVLEERVLYVNRLIEQLRNTFPDHEVSISRQFGDVTPTGAFSGNLGDADKGRGSLRNQDTAEITIKGPKL